MVGPPALVDAVLAAVGVQEAPAWGRTRPMSAHIIARSDDLLDIMLGEGADPEQAFIRGLEQGRREEGDGFEDHLSCDGPTVREL